MVNLLSHCSLDFILSNSQQQQNVKHWNACVHKKLKSFFSNSKNFTYMHYYEKNLVSSEWLHSLFPGQKIISQYFNIGLFNYWKAHMDDSDDEIDLSKVAGIEKVKVREEETEADVRTWSSLAKQFDSD